MNRRKLIGLGAGAATVLATGEVVAGAPLKYGLGHRLPDYHHVPYEAFTREPELVAEITKGELKLTIPLYSFTSSVSWDVMAHYEKKDGVEQGKPTHFTRSKQGVAGTLSAGQNMEDLQRLFHNQEEDEAGFTMRIFHRYHDGSLGHMTSLLEGVVLMNEGAGATMDDLTSEVSYTYVARSIKPASVERQV